MDYIPIGLIIIVVWLVCAIGAYYLTIKKWLPHMDNLTPHERAKLLQSRRQRYIELFNTKKRR